MKELNAIRAEIALIRQENAALRQENQSLKQRIIPRTEQPSPSNPTPPKRKAVLNDPPSPPEPSDRDEQLHRQLNSIENSCRQALSEQKAEYSSLHQSLQANLSALQVNIEAIRTEMHSYFRQIGASINASTAPSAATDHLYNTAHHQQQRNIQSLAAELQGLQ